MTVVRRLQSAGDVVEGRAARLYADARRRVRRRSSSAGLPGVDGAARSDLDQWVSETDRAHDGFRLSVDPVEGSVAVLCSSHRPTDLETVVRSVGTQTHADLELVFVAHGEQWDLEATGERLAQLERSIRRVQMIAAPSSASLGSCLNLAIGRTDARFLAKFDGDDRYGPEYLRDALRAHRIADAGLVGKHTYYAHLAESDAYLLRFPGHDFEYTSTMSGGTFVIDREIVDDQQFADISIGEDRDFIRRCHRRGISTFSGDRFNYTVVRS